MNQTAKKEISNDVVRNILALGDKKDIVSYNSSSVQSSVDKDKDGRENLKDLKPAKTRKPRSKRAPVISRVKAEELKIRPANEVSKVTPAEKLISIASFSKNVALGLAHVYIKKAMSIFNPIIFLFKNLIPITFGSLHLLMPVMFTLVLAKVSFISQAIIADGVFMAAVYYGMIYLASSFFWVTTCILIKSMVDSLLKSLSSMAEVGRNTNIS